MKSDPEERGPSVDLASLDPLANERRYERLIGRIHAAARTELLRRQGPGRLIVGWKPVILMFASLLGLAAISVLLWVRHPDSNSLWTEDARVWTYERMIGTAESD